MVNGPSEAAAAAADAAAAATTITTTTTRSVTFPRSYTTIARGLSNQEVVMYYH